MLAQHKQTKHGGFRVWDSLEQSGGRDPRGEGLEGGRERAFLYVDLLHNFKK